MTSTTKTDNPSPRDLLSELRRLYSKRQIARDPFGRRRALPSEVARVVTQNGGPWRQSAGTPGEE